MSTHRTAEAEAIVSILHESQVYRLGADDLARLRKGIAVPPPDATCGYAVTDSDGEQSPCDRTAHGWRWYQDTEHEDMIDIACVWHENVGGAIIAGLVERLTATEAERDALAAAVARVSALVPDMQANGNSRELGDPRADTWHEAARLILDALDGTA